MKHIVFLFFALTTMTLIAQQEQSIQSGKTKIHLEIFGKGKPLLIINGGPGMSSEGFGSLAKELGKNNLAIIYDQRGTGKSKIDTISSKTMTMDLMVEDIEAIRKHLGIEEWAILGHSFGGMLGSYYTSIHPEKVNGLILSSSGGVDLTLLSTLDITSRLTQTQRDSLNYWTQRIRRGDSSHFAALKRGNYLAPAYVYDKTLVSMVAERLTQGNMRINGLLWENMREIHFDCKDFLKNFKKPVLIIQGEQDIIGKEIAEATHKLFRNSEVIYIDKAVHYGWLEQPELYFGHIRRFLTSLN
ncbi:alpha/beta hydrolase [Subsaxibacter sp. CAU 1640]|uniref:alpha/beta fold hydrolase n=1 Tax=Subsaxibacter sp. CAU 1640 TaxID=2933271 RepID=UPI00200637BE|nr:alpha/beta hydrolase [Subsaxibacter sp. CAU 1640]MCK7590351.1 alpha/beta hydrolase [Subsaxibacter sp. CAU 1640]